MRRHPIPTTHPSARRFVVGVLLAAACGTPPASPETTEIVIPPGASFRAATDTLVAHDIIRHPVWFRTIAKATGAERQVQPGRYAFARGSAASTVLDALRAGRRILTRFTVPEGSTVRQIAALAETELHMAPEAFLRAARDTARLARHAIPAPTAEGYLWPDTYLLDGSETAEALVDLLLEAGRMAWDTGWTRRAGAMGLTPGAVRTLASIVEEEARVPEERAIIAAVYLNRLRLDMPLQADPTVQYAIEERTGARKPRLYQKDYATPSPYNTYRFPGLPPGPISAPSRESIEAVLAPADVPYLFFVAGPDGRHVFSRTYRDHLRAIAAVRRAAR